MLVTTQCANLVWFDLEGWVGAIPPGYSAGAVATSPCYPTETITRAHNEHIQHIKTDHPNLGHPVGGFDTIGAIVPVLTSVIAETVVDKPEDVSMRAFIPGVTRAVVLITLACVAARVASTLIALAKRERPRWLPVIGQKAWMPTPP